MLFRSGVGLAIPHMLWTGSDFIGQPLVSAYWWTLWAIAAAAVLVFRLLVPLTRSLRHDLRVVAVVLGCQSPGGAKPEQRLRDRVAAELMSEGFTRLRQLEAEKALRAAKLPAIRPAPKAAPKPRKEEGFWDWLVDLFSF